MEELQDILNPGGAETPQQIAGSLLGSFSFSWLMAGLLFSAVGLFVFRRGKQKGNLYWILTGISLLVYSYLVTNSYLVWIVGFGLCFFAYLTRFAS